VTGDSPFDHLSDLKLSAHSPGPNVLVRPTFLKEYLRRFSSRWSPASPYHRAKGFICNASSARRRLLALVRHVLYLLRTKKPATGQGVKGMSTVRERRREDRIPYILEVKCDDFGPGALRISDLSRTGAFIDTLLSVRIGSIIQLGFQLHELEINVLAEVRHCVTYIGIGVQFLNLSADEQYFLSFVLAQQSMQQERLSQTQHTGYATQNQLRQF
jgi:hypothetical protein